jgi:uncharacterized MAPEG superfamily protein
MTGIIAVLGFALWTLLLVFISVNWRVLEVLRGKAANSWGRNDAIAKPAIVVRMEHAHFNCLENLPIFATLVFAAYLLNKNAVVDGLACYVLYLRVAQSVTHLLGTSHLLVLARATFFTLQVLMFFYMFWKLLA